MLLGIHHVTAICSDAQANVDFYAGLLGQRLVKVTVNFDDPHSYHLYYGDAAGRPGTLMTFFVWSGAHRGRVGPPQVTATAYATPADAIDFWRRRLASAGVACQSGSSFGASSLRFADPDGLGLEIVASLQPVANDQHARAAGAAPAAVPVEYALRAFHSVTLQETRSSATDAVLRETMRLSEVAEADGVVRYAMGDGGTGRFIDVRVDPATIGRSGAGIVHHVAFRVADDAAQVGWRQALTAAGLHVSEVMERNYFRSIYYREPGGVLFEIATDGPGMAVDEPADALGTTLRLPEWYEPQRAAIVAGLPTFKVPKTGVEFPAGR